MCQGENFIFLLTQVSETSSFFQDITKDIIFVGEEVP